MTTDVEYALMAGRVYQTTRDRMNQFPIPQGWSEFFHVPNNPNYPMFTSASGFEAVSFQNTANPNEIVISYAGTGPGMNQDWWANFGLTTGFGAEQLLQAAEYYLQVKASNPPNANIAFTGHSLGGGLAALMGVFFGKKAVTFDPAPFAHSAEPNVLPPDVAMNLKNALASQLDANGVRVYSEETLSGLTNYLQARDTNGGIPNENLVRKIHVDGEALSAWFPNSWMIGVQTPPLTHGATDVSATNLHSQALLIAFMENVQFREVTFKLTDLLGMIFDSNLYYNDPNKLVDPNRNFLENLIRHQVGLDPAVPNDGAHMLDRFTADLLDIAQEGGLTMTDNLTKALIAFAMQAYYDNRLASDKKLFSDVGVSGGIRFDRSDIADTLDAAKGYNNAEGNTKYFQDFLTTLPAAEQLYINTELP